MTHRAVLTSARFAGTVVRITRRPFRVALRAAPGVAGAVFVAIGLGEIAGHLWGHDLTRWVAAVIGGGFLVWIGADINRAPPAPRGTDD